MKNILVMDHNSASTERQRIYIRLMERHGYRVSIVVPEVWPDPLDPDNSGSRPHPEFSGGYFPVKIFLGGNVPLHFYRGTFRSVIGQVKPNLIYAYNDYYMLASFQMFMANRLFARVPIGFYASQNIAKAYPFPFSWMERAVLRNADFLFPISEDAERIAVEKNFGGKSYALPLYVDTEIFSPRSTAPPLRTRLNVAPESFLVGFAGRLVEEKGLGGVIDALAMLGDPMVHLVLIGSGPLEASLMRQAREAGLGLQVHLLPAASQADLAPVLADMDVVVMPSLTRANWKEQFGRLLIEAQACGTPVIGSDSGAIPEVIRSTGGGVVVAEGDSLALATAIGRMRNDPDELAALRARGLRNSVELYSLDAFVDRMDQAFLDQIGSRR